MSKPRYLTKSRYKLAKECPTKLFYTGKKEYANSKLDDAFLAALADGGYQVGELAKCYYPGGHDITTLDYEEAEKQTNDLLQSDDVIIFEPAIRFKNLFIRVDVLVKRANKISLIEVKAKSFSPSEENPFLNKNGSMKSNWKPYLYDIAFQKYVLANALPDIDVSAYLMMANKDVPCPVNGLNQKFQIVKDETNRKGIQVSNSLGPEDLKDKILIKVPVDDEIDLIWEGKENGKKELHSFVNEIEYFSSNYASDTRINSSIGSHCTKCEFKCSEGESGAHRDGFKECWINELDWSESDFEEPTVLDIWNFRKKDKLIESGRIKISEVSEEDISPKPDKRSGVSPSERQWLQVKCAQEKLTEPRFNFSGMSEEMSSWTYPLHFIDFETTAVAIPFNKGLRPYEGIAFQFSHHIAQENGTIYHAGQYLNVNPGEFPNFEFLRELKKQLEKDNGTIFRYAPHENTFLNLIYRQLCDFGSDEKDQKELCKFVQSITTSVGSSAEKWIGPRNMVDMWALVKRHFYSPLTNGSNSIKYVLPAILNSSETLQKKYSHPIYGVKGGITSMNFKDFNWIEMKDGAVIDPYKRLPKMFTNISTKNLNLLMEEDELRNGGAALTAYGKMQFTNMTDIERQEIKRALLKYCELDTFAMVLIYEYWKDLLNNATDEVREQYAI